MLHVTFSLAPSSKKSFTQYLQLSRETSFKIWRWVTLSLVERPTMGSIFEHGTITASYRCKWRKAQDIPIPNFTTASNRQWSLNNDVSCKYGHLSTIETLFLPSIRCPNCATCLSYLFFRFCLIYSDHTHSKYPGERIEQWRLIKS